MTNTKATMSQASIDDTFANFDNNNNSIENSSDECILDSFRYIGGRRFHNVLDAKYFLPNDNGEVDRLEGQHFLYRHIWQGNFSSPVTQRLQQPGACVLDVGCGPGSWILEMSCDFPSAIFVGLDISPIFPPEQKKPPNATFLQANLLDGLPFPDGTFDFVYQRFMSSALEESQWRDEVIAELVRVIKPGGWIELMELDVVCTEDTNAPTYQRFNRSLMDFLADRGINGLISSKLKGYLESTKQLTNIQCEERSTRIGQWGGRLGEMMCVDLLEGVAACKPALSQFMNITYDEFDSMLQTVRMEVDSSQFCYKTHRQV
ncbi:S-adenosyl-L-methionine-dependent methyltransferase [Gigaspora rosea]|uniref:S-adenosyl-L-methionine-dependent methyltransferase n=1 Tax=Gigaspora rosea TaxID=44941 RepID=A0A397U736_9GLOM|nr:S-adenosyl-L-methionine-dependent methyltransferase [Gigaspora rosea]